jgi:DNA-binding winged helix-turn-helix (wHTH) protein/tetratricopeptide (TPR) repeat protein
MLADAAPLSLAERRRAGSPAAPVMIASDQGGMMPARIVLAHEAPFMLGPVEVRPATRTIARDDVETVIEPRVMQVLVALAGAHGAVVSRDDLIERCWEGRIVGDDAINRVLSRLRHLETDDAGAPFRVETITRVGYRLVPNDPATAAPGTAAPAGRSAPPRTFDRRGLLAAAGVGTALAAGGGWWFGLRRPSLPPAALAAMERGDIALSQTVPDQAAVAVAAYRQATELAPDAAEPWGKLAQAYQMQLIVSGAADAAGASLIDGRARSAIAHALAIDPDNADALAVRATLGPMYRRWFDIEAACRPLLARFPDHGPLNRLYGILLWNVGRGAASLAHLRSTLATEPNWPQVQMRVMVALWSAGRLDEADAIMERAFAIWPRHYSIWFCRQRLLTYTGRGPAALAMLADRDGRPIAIPEWNFATTEAETRAIMTRDPGDIAAASRLLYEAAHRAVGLAGNAIVFHAAIGRLDDAFALCDAYFFDRGFTIGPQRYSVEQGMRVAQRDRETGLLFTRETAPMRADPRFARLMQATGLEDYWRRSGTKPDYRR